MVVYIVYADYGYADYGVAGEVVESAWLDKEKAENAQKSFGSLVLNA